MGNAGLQTIPKASSSVITKSACCILDEAHGTQPDLARVSDNSVVGGLPGDWTGAHLPCAAESTAFGSPACPGPAQTFRLKDPPDLHPGRGLVSQEISHNNKKSVGEINSPTCGFCDL